MPIQKPNSFGYFLLIKNAPFLYKPSNSFASLENNLKILKTAANTRNFKFGKTVHAHLIRTNQTGSDIIQTNCLLNLYAKCGRISSARHLFDRMPKKNVVSWSVLIAGYFHNGLALDALSLFTSMSHAGSPRPNKYIFATVLSSCSYIQALCEGKQCHAYILKSGLVFHSYVRNALLYMYSRCSDVEGALRVFETVLNLDIFSSNAMICAFLEHGYVNEALELLRNLVNEFEWDHVTFIAALGICAALKDSCMGLQIHNHILRRDIELNVFVCSAIVDMYGKCGKILSARNAFHGLQVQNVVSWTTLMSAYSQNGFFEEAVNIFSEMEEEGVRPNEFTYAVMLNACAGLSALRHGDVLNAHVEKLGFKQHLVVGNALINMYAKSGDIEDAYKVFKGMVWRDTVTWNSIISGYSHHSLGNKALKVFHHMLLVGEVPNYVTFVGVLSACAHLGLVNDGFYYVNQLMKKIGITPGVEHYTCIVGLLGRAGLLDEADNFMRSAPIEWDIIAWRTLLSACQVHRNFGLGMRVAEFILHIDPNDVGTYVLLSNMYAKAKRWDGVVKIRMLMRERDIKKEPGVSWIQVRNNTHVFVSEDKNHPQSSQIYGKLAELLEQIKVVGYVPDTASVLHDVEDEQKEEYLKYHSEKLAIAFGIINTPLGAPLHVIKNLRMCEDCHTYAKLISNVTERKIIVRDVNRFHCFESGVCSCGDYW